MSNAKKKPLHRALAALLALVMVLTLIPWQTTAYAKASGEDADEGGTSDLETITFVVKSGKNKVKDATVSLTVYEAKTPDQPEGPGGTEQPDPESGKKTGGQPAQGTTSSGKTDKDGEIEFAVAADAKFTYKVEKSGYKTVEVTEQQTVPENGEVEVDLVKLKAYQVTAAAVEDITWDGDAHELVKVSVELPTKMGDKTVLAEQEVTNGKLPDGVESVSYQAVTADGQTISGEGIPAATNVKDALSGASVTMTVVLKADLNAAEPTQTVEVTAAKIVAKQLDKDAINVSALELKYKLDAKKVDALKQELAAVGTPGFVEGDDITWTVTAKYVYHHWVDVDGDGKLDWVKEREWSSKGPAIPKDGYKGQYTIRLVVYRNQGNEVYDYTFVTDMQSGEIVLVPDSKIEANKLTCSLGADGSPVPQDLVTVTGHNDPAKYTVWYQFRKVTDPESEWSALATTIPQAAEPGRYQIKAVAIDATNNNVVELGVVDAEGVTGDNDAKVGVAVIEKIKPELEFTARAEDGQTPLYPDGKETEMEITKIPDPMSFAAKAENAPGLKISYQIIDTDSETAGAASIEPEDVHIPDDPATPENEEVNKTAGTLTITAVGDITIQASVEETAYYEGKTIRHTLSLEAKESLIKGENVSYANASEHRYIIGTGKTEQGYTVANKAANKTEFGKNIKNTEIRYSIRDDAGSIYDSNRIKAEDSGITVENGQVDIKDMAKLIRYVEDKGQNNSLTVYVMANLRQKVKDDEPKSVGYDTYPLTIKFADPLVDANGAAVDMDTKLLYDGKPGGKKDWYTDKVTVTAAEGFSIYQVEKKNGQWSFEKKDSVTLDGQGPEIAKNVYIAQDSDGAVFAMHKASKKIDTVKPSDITIEFKEPTVVEKIGEWLHIYNAQATIVVTAKDQTSGVKEFKVEYIKDGQEQAAEIFTLPAVAKDSEGTYTAEMKLPEGELKQYRGHLRVTAIDHAGLSLEREEIDNDSSIIIDGEVPVMNVYYGEKPGYEAQVNTVDGIHYYAAATKAEFVVAEDNFRETKMNVTVMKDGNELELKPKWAEGDPHAAPDVAQAKPAHVGTMMLEKDGDYQITVAGEDAANNMMEGYVSETIQIDTKAPALNKVVLTPADHSAEGVFYHKGNVTFLFTLKERNFYPDEVVLEITKNGEKMTTLPAITWYDEVPEELEKKVGELEKYEHLGVMTLEAQANHSADGDYIVTLNYTDRAKNVMETYTSEQHTIDTLLNDPVVTYEPMEPVLTKKDSEKQDRQYFAGQRVATVVIDEHNFDPERVVFTIDAKDVSGKDVKNEKNVVLGKWVSEGDKHTMTITYPGDANYTFDMKYSDLATNEYDGYEKDYFTVDTTKPVTKGVEYSTAVLDTMVHSEKFGFYNAVVTVTITAEDPTSGVESFLYSYRNAPGVSQVNKELIDKAISAAQIEYSDDNKTASAQFKLPAKLVKDTQFNGKVDFTATDRSGNVSKKHQETKRVVVDNIAPIADISFNKPVNVVNGIHYYAGNINAVVSVNEANFFQNDVIVMVSKDGGAATRVSPKWRSAGGDIHNGTFTITGDGDYVVSVAYTDKSSNKMTSYKSAQLTIDTQIKAPAFSINGASRNENGGSYKKDAVIGFAFNDRNFASKTIQLTRTNFDSRVDVTDQFVKVNGNSKGGAGSFAIPAKTVNDGIYTMTVSISDKANHTAKSTMNFTVNRFGSVYEYSDSLVDLIRDGGQYVTKVEEDLVITEYNADKIKNGSLKIMITRDGEAIDVDYKAVPVNGGGWNKYVYTIDADNFKADGLYKISVSSAYPTSDSDKNESASVPENSVNEKGGKILDKMSFTVDTQKPEIRNIVNMDEPIVNATELKVEYNIVDVGGIQAIEVLVNGESVDKVTEFGEDVLNYTGAFVLKEMSGAQKIQLRITDRAGNITDTAAEDFNAEELAFKFNDEMTVSTSFFVRWYANKGLFWGSICGVVVLAGAIWYLVAGKRRKNNGSAQ